MHEGERTITKVCLEEGIVLQLWLISGYEQGRVMLREEQEIQLAS